MNQHRPYGKVRTSVDGKLEQWAKEEQDWIHAKIEEAKKLSEERKDGITDGKRLSFTAGTPPAEASQSQSAASPTRKSSEGNNYCHFCGKETLTVSIFNLCTECAYVKKPKKASSNVPDDISLCPSCKCMTKTIGFRCGKCGEAKPSCLGKKEKKA